MPRASRRAQQPAPPTANASTAAATTEFTSEDVLKELRKVTESATRRFLKTAQEAIDSAMQSEASYESTWRNNLALSTFDQFGIEDSAPNGPSSPSDGQSATWTDITSGKNGRKGKGSVIESHYMVDFPNMLPTPKFTSHVPLRVNVINPNGRLLRTMPPFDAGSREEINIANRAVFTEDEEYALLTFHELAPYLEHLQFIQTYIRMFEDLFAAVNLDARRFCRIFRKLYPSSDVAESGKTWAQNCQIRSGNSSNADERKFRMICATIFNTFGVDCRVLVEVLEERLRHKAQEDKLRKAVKTQKSPSQIDWQSICCRLCHQIFCTEHGEFLDPTKGAFTDDEKDEIIKYGFGGRDEDGHLRQHQLMRKFEANNISKYFTAASNLHSSPPQGSSKNPSKTSLEKWGQNYVERYYPCDHEGSCEDARCSCFTGRTLCMPLCCCGKLGACKRLRKGCTCAQKGRPCTTGECSCVNNILECHPDLCGTCGARELLDPVNVNADEDDHKCGNCCIQLNRPVPTCIGESGLQGVGLYALTDIREGDFIGEYKGEVVQINEVGRRFSKVAATAIGVSYNLSLVTREEKGKVDVDALYSGNKTRFINSLDKQSNCDWESCIVNYTHKMGIRAKRDIRAGEELFVDYGPDYFKHHGGLKMVAKSPVRSNVESQETSKRANAGKKMTEHKAAQKTQSQPKNRRGKGTRRPGEIVRGHPAGKLPPGPEEPVDDEEPQIAGRKRSHEQEEEEQWEQSRPAKKPRERRRKHVGIKSLGKRK